MHADSWRELHKIAHRRIDKPRSGRGRHIHIRIRDYRPFPAINNSAINTGNVIKVLVRDVKCSARSQVTGAPGANRRLHDAAVVVKEVGFLLREIELHGVLGKGHARQTPKHYAHECDES